jgi:hypothetical protein
MARGKVRLQYIGVYVTRKYYRYDRIRYTRGKYVVPICDTADNYGTRVKSITG